MKILLTGGSGFLGSALASRLQDDGHEVSLLLRHASSLRRLTGRSYEIGRYSSQADLHGFLGHVRPHAVIHTACSYGRHGESLSELTDANVQLGLSMLQALSESPVDRCLFINTGTALPPTTSAYALSKHQFAQWGYLQTRRVPDRFRFINIELQHMYGPGDDASKFTMHVLHACYRNDRELRLTAGEQRRDFIFIDDVVDAYALLLEKFELLGNCRDVPLGSGTAPAIRNYVETVHRLCASRTELRFGALEYRPDEPMHCQADLGLMNRLGWAPRWSLEAGLERTIAQEFK